MALSTSSVRRYQRHGKVIHSVTPNGVEHLQADRELRGDQVIHSVTPNGVEHQKINGDAGEGFTVIHSVTPNGVEHNSKTDGVVIVLA